MSFTSTVTKDKYGRPENAYLFSKSIEYSQPSKNTLWGEQSVLFNKGRYFECSVYPSHILKQVSELIGIPIEYTNMIVGTWDKLEDFVIAMNILGIYVKITIDWI